MIAHRLSSIIAVVVRPFTFSYRQLLLLNQLTKFKIILQECSLGGSLLNLFKEFYSMQNFGCNGNKRWKINQNLKSLLVQKYWIDLKTILRKCSLGYLLPRLFAYFRSVETHGRQGARLIFLICALLKLLKSSCPKELARFENYFAQMFLGAPFTKIVQIFPIR